MYVLLLSVASLTAAWAQDEDDGEEKDKVQSAKVALITKRLSLTSEQARPFWAVYDEFEKERRSNLKSLTQLRDRFQVASDDELKAGLKQMLEVRRKDVDIEKEYLNKFTKVISARQTAELYKTEFEFQKAIWDRVLKGSGQSADALENAKVAFLNTKMKLTPEQSKQFWPVYNEMEKEKESNQQAMAQLRNAIKPTSSEDEIKTVLKQMADLRQKEVYITKRQMDRFLRVINNRQTAMFYKGEIDFRREIIREWREQRREHRQDMRQQFQDRRQQRQERMQNRPRIRE
jgi:hypothetical protein